MIADDEFPPEVLLDNDDDDIEIGGNQLELHQSDDEDPDDFTDTESIRGEKKFEGDFPIYEYATLANIMEDAINEGCCFFVNSLGAFVNCYEQCFEITQEPLFDIIEDQWKLRLWVLYKFVDELEIPFHLARELEKFAVFNKSVSDSYRLKHIANFANTFFVKTYKQNYVSLLTVLRNSECPLLQRIVEGDVSGKEVMLMSYREKWEEAWVGFEVGRLAVITMEPQLLGDSLIECLTCKSRGRPSRKVAWVQVQTRSADEGISTMAHCLTCNKHFKFC